VVSALFGLFQGGIVPAYTIIIREYIAPAEAGLRVGIVLMATLFGKALGGWVSGAIFELTGSPSARCRALSPRPGSPPCCPYGGLRRARAAYRPRGDPPYRAAFVNSIAFNLVNLEHRDLAPAPRVAPARVRRGVNPAKTAPRSAHVIALLAPP
jgi:MFS family permease